MTYTDIWPSAVAPGVIILSGFGIVLFLVLFVQFNGWFCNLFCCNKSTNDKKYKVDRMDLTHIPTTTVEEREKEVEREFDRSDSQLQHHILDSQHEAHERLMSRLRRGSVRVQHLKATSSISAVHPLTRRPTGGGIASSNTKATEDDY
jgi:hypothetical protein